MAHFTSRDPRRFSRRRILGALIVQGGLAPTVSGRVGNSVFSRNRGGAYIRNFVKPVNPATALQGAIRAVFSFLSAAWASLGSSGQSTWNDLSIAAPQPNRVGLTSTLPALAMFQKINVGRVAAGLTVVTTPPSAPITDTWNPALFGFEVPSNNSITIFFDGSADWVVNGGLEDALLFYLSPPQSAGVNFYKGKFNFFGGINGGTTGATIQGFPGGFTAAGAPTTGSLTLSLIAGPNFIPGMKYFARAYVTRQDGHLGPDGTGTALGQ